jgi:rhomboid family GlyGly-CTERM serine protease
MEGLVVSEGKKRPVPVRGSGLSAVTFRAIRHAPVTLGTVLAVLLANGELMAAAGARTGGLLGLLEWNRSGLARGEVWRVLTGNFVHVSALHLAFDLVPLLLLGVLYERFFGFRYLWIVLGCAAAVGVSILWLKGGLTSYRGLSGVDHGLLAAGLVVDLSEAARRKRRGLWVLALSACSLALLKITYECVTGELLIYPGLFGPYARPVPLAHLVGAASGGFLALLWLKGGAKQAAIRKVNVPCDSPCGGCPSFRGRIARHVK